MSDIGVHSNIYQRVREYGQLMDEVILGMRSRTMSADDPTRRRLGELLAGLAGTPPADPRTAWFGMLVGSADPAARSDWARLGRALLSPSVDADVIGKLQVLARRLEQRRTEALAKMRGKST